jgi:hypothetical protein
VGSGRSAQPVGDARPYPAVIAEVDEEPPVGALDVAADEEPAPPRISLG